MSLTGVDGRAADVERTVRTNAAADARDGNGVAHTYVEVRSPTTLQSVHGKFYGQGAEICARFIANYFRDGYGHLGDVKLRK